MCVCVGFSLSPNRAQRECCSVCNPQWAVKEWALEPFFQNESMREARSTSPLCTKHKRICHDMGSGGIRRLIMWLWRKEPRPQSAWSLITLPRPPEEPNWLWRHTAPPRKSHTDWEVWQRLRVDVAWLPQRYSSVIPAGENETTEVKILFLWRSGSHFHTLDSYSDWWNTLDFMSTCMPHSLLYNILVLFLDSFFPPVKSRVK